MKKSLLFIVILSGLYHCCCPFTVSHAFGIVDVRRISAVHPEQERPRVHPITTSTASSTTTTSLLFSQSSPSSSSSSSCPDDIPTLLQDLTNAGIRFPPTATKQELQQLWEQHNIAINTTTHRKTKTNTPEQDHPHPTPQSLQTVKPMEEWSLAELLQALRVQGIRFSPTASRAELEEALRSSQKATAGTSTASTRSSNDHDPSTSSCTISAATTNEKTEQETTNNRTASHNKNHQRKSTESTESSASSFYSSSTKAAAGEANRRSTVRSSTSSAPSSKRNQSASSQNTRRKAGENQKEPQSHSSKEKTQRRSPTPTAASSSSSSPSTPLEVVTAEILEKRTDDYLKRQAKRNKRRGIVSEDNSSNGEDDRPRNTQTSATVVVPIVEKKRVVVLDSDNDEQTRRAPRARSTGTGRRTTTGNSQQTLSSRRPRPRRPQSIDTDDEEEIAFQNETGGINSQPVSGENGVVIIPADQPTGTSSGRRRRPSRAESRSKQTNKRIYSPYYNDVRDGNVRNNSPNTPYETNNAYSSRSSSSRTTRRRDAVDRLSDAVQNAADFVMFGYYESTGGSSPSQQTRRRQRQPSQNSEKSSSTVSDDRPPPRHWKDRMEERFDSMLGIHEEGEFYNSWMESDDEEGGSYEKGSSVANGAPPYSRRRRGGDPLTYGYSYLSQGANLLNDFFLGEDYPQSRRYTNKRPPSPRRSSSSVTFGNGGTRGSLLSVLGAAGRVGQSLCTWASVGGALPRRVVAAGVAVVGLCARQYKFRAMFVSLLAFRALGEVAANSWMDGEEDFYYDSPENANRE